MTIPTIHISSARGMVIFVRAGSWMIEVDSLLEAFLTRDPQYHSSTRYNRWLPSITQPRKLQVTTGTSPGERSQLGKLFMTEILVRPTVICKIQGKVHPITRGCYSIERGGDVSYQIPHIYCLGVIRKTEDEESQPVEQERQG